ncbi:hypothetical protein [uncultured Devosia sp.]|uniref:hypothetical protein n=1 Tax=uncultured Devosia sp. TaxID=211434 RepID=UPI00262487F0|nr:hypothetical protein [uncultured Devosia sp.]
MSRARIAIAHFADARSVDGVIADLNALGCDGLGALPETVPGLQGSVCRLEVALPPARERAVLNVLLNSEALRVDIHDAPL